MTQRLFWKILIGFWITIIFITQGVWLMFTLLRPVPPEVDATVTGIDVAAFAASVMIEREGGPTFEGKFKTWPGYLRNQMEIVSLGSAKPPPKAIMAVAPDGKRYGVVVHPHPPHREHRGPWDIPWEVIVVSIVGGLGFSAILAWYLAAPIKRMRLGFDSLAKGDFSTRLGPAIGRRRDEIADLARDFDTMAKRLEELVRARDRLLAGVSHELRSPLARLQLAIGLARQDSAKVGTSLERISREAVRLDEMVGELLTLSKLESGVHMADQYFDLAQVVEAVVEDAKFEAGPMGVEVKAGIDTADIQREWIAPGSGKLISRAVENIVRNAIRFSRRGQTVRVTLDRQGHLFRISVCDQGPGVSQDQLQTIFKPFVQGEGGDGKGFGLGLAIAERAIVAHGGAISARNEPGNGLLIVALLPAQEE